MAGIGETLAELQVKIKADSTQLKSGLDDAGKATEGFAQRHSKAIKGVGIAMAAMGAAVIAAGVLSIKTYAQMGDAVQKMALRTGFSTEALSELRHAAELSGASLEGIEKASRTLSGAISDAGDGLATYVRAFDKIGLSYEDLKGKSPEKQFLMVMEALAGVEDESLRVALAADLMGRSGTAMLPILASGAEGLREMRQEAHDLGIVFDQEAANKAAKLKDAMTRMNDSINGVKMVIAENLIPVLLPLIDKIKEIVSGISAWAKEHPELARVITLVTGATGLLMIALAPLLIFLPQIVAAFTIMRTFMIAKLIPTIVAMTTALWAKVAALYAVMVAMGPAGWAMAAASLGIIASGLTVIIWKATNSMKGLTNEVNAYIPVAGGATGVTDELSGSLTELERTILRVKEAEVGLTKSTERYNEVAKDKHKLLLTSKLGIRELIETYKPYNLSLEAELSGLQETSKWLESKERLLGKQKDAVETLLESSIHLSSFYATWGGIGTLPLSSYPVGTIAQALMLATPERGAGWAYARAVQIAGKTVGFTPGAAFGPAGTEVFQHGGIITRPTMGLLGEAGPEAVIPLDKFRGGVNITLSGIFMGNESEARKLADLIRKELRREERFLYGSAVA